MEQSPHPTNSNLASLLCDGALTLGIPLSPHVAARLVLYSQELIRWNSRMNLTAIESEVEVISKHFLDSLSAFKVFDARAGLRVLDVGSGGGFPGLVLALHAPVLSVTLLEPSMKKAAFLCHVVGRLGVLNAKIETKRIEEFSNESGFHLVTSRALRLENLAASALRLLAPGGVLLLYRASNLVSPPDGYEIIRQISFELPFTQSHRTLSLLKRCNDPVRPIQPIPVIS